MKIITVLPAVLFCVASAAQQPASQQELAVEVDRLRLEMLQLRLEFEIWKSADLEQRLDQTRKGREELTQQETALSDAINGMQSQTSGSQNQQPAELSLTQVMSAAGELQALRAAREAIGAQEQKLSEQLRILRETIQRGQQRANVLLAELDKRTRGAR